MSYILKNMHDIIWSLNFRNFIRGMQACGTVIRIALGVPGFHLRVPGLSPGSASHPAFYLCLPLETAWLACMGSCHPYGGSKLSSDLWGSA